MSIHSENSFRKSYLSNGIRIVTERMSHVRSVSLGVWVYAGSRDERQEKCGISHFIEHMMFKGTERRSTREIASSLEDVGGHLNAFTSKELSCYSAHILDEHLPLAIDVISDILLHSRFDTREISKEKQVIFQEIDSYRESPEDMVFENFYGNMYPHHPLGNLIYGTRQTINGFRRADILDYLKNNYTQNRIVIAAVGNIEHEHVVKLIEKYFAELPEFAPPQRDTPQNKPKDDIYRDSCTQTHLCYGAIAYSYNEPKKFPLLILDTVLGAGMSSRLFQNIREKHGVAYTIYSFADFYSDTGLFGVYVASDPGDAERCLHLISREFKKLRDKPLSVDELQRVKSQLTGNLALGLESTASHMHRIAKMELYIQEHMSIDVTLKRIEAVTAAQVQQVAEELLSEENLHITQLQPETYKKE